MQHMDDEVLRRQRRRRWRVGATMALLGGLAATAFAMAPPDEEPDSTFCSADGMITPYGWTYGRSGRLGCPFVDDRGELVRFTNQGEPLCYDESIYVVPCDQPGARPPADDDDG